MVPKKKKNENDDINHNNGSEDIPTLENYDCYIEVACRNNGVITLWIGTNPIETIRWNVIANQKTRIPINKNKINDPPGYLDHLIQSGGSDIGLFYVNLSGLGNYKIVNGDYLFQTASSLNIVIFGDVEFDTVNGSCLFAFQGCDNISDITCKQSVKDFLQSKAAQAYLPQKFRIGGVGAWHIT